MTLSIGAIAACAALSWATGDFWSVGGEVSTPGEAAGASEAPAASPDLLAESGSSPVPESLPRRERVPAQELMVGEPPMQLGVLGAMPSMAELHDSPRAAPQLHRQGSIEFAVFDAATNRPVMRFDYAVEVIGTAPVKGSSMDNHRAGAPAPLDMPFNLRIEAQGYATYRLRQVLIRSGEPRRTHTIRLRRDEYAVK